MQGLIDRVAATIACNNPTGLQYPWHTEAAAAILRDHVEAKLAEVRAVVDRQAQALEQIAGSHWERFGIDQTDIEQIPDLSADEAMNLARDTLSLDHPVVADRDRTIAEQAAELAKLREALRASHDATAEYYRYWTGGETRGSYDGKPERANLWKAMYSACAALGGSHE